MVRDRLHRSGFTPLAATQWLHAPNPMLDGRTPLRVIADGLAGKVMDAIAALDDGAYM